MNLDNFLPLAPSDVVLLFDFVLACAVAGYFIFGGPFFSWTRDQLGWVIFWYSVVTVGLLFQISWPILFNEKLPEWARFMLATTFGIGLLFKGNAMRVERRRGRLAAARYLATEGGPIMNAVDNLTLDEIKDATTIWYKGKRVLRTAFATLITILPIAPQVIAIVNEQWSSEFLIAVGIQAVAINAVITRVMAIPTVNAWLMKIGLGSVPASAVQKSIRTGDVFVEAPKENRGS